MYHDLGFRYTHPKNLAFRHRGGLGSGWELYFDSPNGLGVHQVDGEFIRRTIAFFFFLFYSPFKIKLLRVLFFIMSSGKIITTIRKKNKGERRKGKGAERIRPGVFVRLFHISVSFFFFIFTKFTCVRACVRACLSVCGIYFFSSCI